MMDKKVKSISAIGTRGYVEGKRFIAKRDNNGKYVLNRKKTKPNGGPTNKAVNKVYVDSLDEAAELLRSGDYLINLIGPSGQRALRELGKVTIE